MRVILAQCIHAPEASQGLQCVNSCLLKCCHFALFYILVTLFAATGTANTA